MCIGRPGKNDHVQQMEMRARLLTSQQMEPYGVPFNLG